MWLIRINLDVEIARKQLAKEINIINSNLSILKTGKARTIRFSTLETICKTLNCQPGDILEDIEDKCTNN